MLFTLLGTVGINSGQEAVEVGPAKQRCVLAALLTEQGRVVPIESLIDRVWGQDPPPSARSTLYSYVTRIRTVLRSLDSDAQGVALFRQAGGYALVVPRDMVDLHRFRRLVEEARSASRTDQAGDLLNEALGLWQGDPLSGVSGAWVDGMRLQLEEERILASLHYYEVQLGNGHGEDTLPWLRALVAAHPFDERLAGNLMTALHENGRQSEALQLYDGIRDQLADELGVEPGQDLRRAHQSVLRASPSLNGSKKSAPVSPLLRQLPPPPIGVTGRVEECAVLDRIGTVGAGGVMTIVGAGGIGKTWLALHWAHRNLDRFPDGQLYLNLRGFDRSSTPTSKEGAVRSMLAALGVEAAAVPTSADAQAGLYRSLVAGKRLLIVLDNVRDAGQIEPLLPGDQVATVMVISRNQLSGLSVSKGARGLTLYGLSDAEARELLSNRVGTERVAAEADAVDTLLDRCSGLPLALAILAARATTHPEFPLAVLADELRAATGRLDAFDLGDLSVDLRAVFATSFCALGPDAARTIGLLSLAPGPDISLAAAGALLGRPLSGARVLLRTLEAAHLVEQHTHGRYRMHDLVRLYATECAVRDLPDDVRHAALHRLVDFYTHTACAADSLLWPHRSTIDVRSLTGSHSALVLEDTTAALAWFDTEHPCLLASLYATVEVGLHRATWQLAWALDTYHLRRSHLRDRLSTWQAACVAAGQLGETAVQGVAQWRFGHALAQAGQHARALEHLDRAHSIFKEGGELDKQAHVHNTTGFLWSHQGDHARALVHAESALRLHQAAGGGLAWVAVAHNAVAWCLAQLDRYEEAYAHGDRAVALSRELNDRDGIAASEDSLGFISHKMGLYAEALKHYDSAVTLRQEIGNAYQEADSLVRMGATYVANGEDGQARRAWYRAAGLLRVQKRLAALERVEADLDALV